MTEQELEVIDSLAKSWNEFMKLTWDKDDYDDFRKAIHDAQRIIMSREAQRNNPKTFRQPPL